MSVEAAMAPVNLLEYEAAARAVMPKSLFDFVAGGAEDQITLAGNRAAFDRWRLVPRVLAGVDEPALTTTVLGQPVSMPVIVSPMGLHQLAHPDGELASAAAARRAGTIFSLSVAASCLVDDVAARAGAWWFQIYLLADRGLTRDVAARAAAAGAAALVLTVDVPVRGRREADERNGFGLPLGMTMPNLLPRDQSGGLPSYLALTRWERLISWGDLEWLAGVTELPVVVKGILAPEDARLAFGHGARAVIVSNHGGRQLDSAVASLDALPAVVEAVAGAGEVLLDGGVRRGTDVLKALALGARAVMMGRPLMYGLATGGEEGAFQVLDLLREELTTDFLLCGLRDVAAIGRSLVAPVGVLGGQEVR